MHTFGTIRDTRVRISSLRSQRVVGRGAPRDMTDFALRGHRDLRPDGLRQVRRSRRRSPIASAPRSSPPTRSRCIEGCRSSRTSRPARRASSPSATCRETMSVGEYADARTRGDRRARRDERGAPSSPAERVCTCARRSSTWTIPPAARRRRAAPASKRLYDADPDAAHDAASASSILPPAAAVHVNDRRRVVRALELAEGGSLARPRRRTSSGRRTLRRPTLVVGLDVLAGGARASDRARAPTR